MEKRARLGMAMFLLSQAVFFLFLIIGSVYFHQAGIGVTTALGVYTLCLASSSFTMWRAAAGTAVRVWLAATILLGGAFVGGQGRAYVRAFPYRNVASALLAVVGFHELYVAVGIVLLGIALWNCHRSVLVRTVALYWHFVVAVWIVIVAVGMLV